MAQLQRNMLVAEIKKSVPSVINGGGSWTFVRSKPRHAPFTVMGIVGEDDLDASDISTATTRIAFLNLFPATKPRRT
jgi:hypothetical protein